MERLREEIPADIIPGYSIVRELGRGGQGVVYEAVQLTMHRRVALKVMLPFACADRVSRYRFEREVALVADLRHPNIVPVYDCGVAHDRYYYYAMEYIHGQTLKEYVRSCSLDDRSILRTFSIVCHAVNFAHQKGVTHRDLKPSNVLMDERGRPYIVDFGLAKISDGRRSEPDGGGTVSVTGQLIGTLPYMCPEQAGGHPDQIDLRSDVYSLGVILYELLTNSFPYKVSGPHTEVINNILMAEPQKPSAVRRTISSEVDTIVLKSLSKCKERRYETSGALGREIDRYLAGEPIEAKRDSALYVLGKMAKRHRSKVVASALVTLLCVLSSLGILVNYAGRIRLAAELENTAIQLKQSNHELTTTNHRLSRRLYASTLVGIQNALENHDTDLVRSLMASCETRPEMKFWEWQRLVNQMDRSHSAVLVSDQSVRCSAWSPTGEFFATGAYDGVVKVWDAEALALRYTVPVGDGKEAAFALAFSRDGNRLAFGLNRLTMIDVRTGEIIWQVDQLGELRGADFCPDDRYLVTASISSELTVWDSESGKRLMTGRESVNEGDWKVGHLCARFSPSGEHFATAGMNGRVLLWDVNTGEIVKSFVDAAIKSPAGDVAHLDAVNAVAFDPHGRWLASAADDRMIKLWDVETGELVGSTTGHTDWVRDIQFRPDGHQLVTVSRDATVRTWDVPSLRPIVVLLGHSAYVRSVAYRGDGSQFLTASADGTVRLWSANSMPLRIRMTSDGYWHKAWGAEDAIRAVAVTSDQSPNRLISAHNSGVLRQWNCESGEEVASWRVGQSVSRVAIADEKQMAIADRGGKITLFDLWERRVIAEYEGDGQPVKGLLFDRKRRELVAIGDHGLVRVWNIDSRQLVRQFLVSRGSVTCAALGQHPPRLIIGFADGLAQVNHVTSKVLWEICDPALFVASLAVQANENAVAAGCVSGVITIWDAAIGQQLATFHAHTGPVNALTYAWHDQRILSGGHDGAVRLWDPPLEQPLTTLSRRDLGDIRSFHKEVICITHDAHSDAVVAGFGDGSIYVWESTELATGYGPRRIVIEARELVDQLRQQYPSYDEVIRVLHAEERAENEIKQVALRIAAARRQSESPTPMGHDG
jgi:WD40 repeat protein/predicted Ser/Thr protein kinase